MRWNHNGSFLMKPMKNGYSWLVISLWNLSKTYETYEKQLWYPPILLIQIDSPSDHHLPPAPPLGLQELHRLIPSELQIFEGHRTRGHSSCVQYPWQCWFSAGYHGSGCQQMGSGSSYATVVGGSKVWMDDGNGYGLPQHFPFFLRLRTDLWWYMYICVYIYMKYRERERRRQLFSNLQTCLTYQTAKLAQTARIRHIFSQFANLSNFNKFMVVVTCMICSALESRAWLSPT